MLCRAYLYRNWFTTQVRGLQDKLCISTHILNEIKAKLRAHGIFFPTKLQVISALKITLRGKQLNPSPHISLFFAAKHKLLLFFLIYLEYKQILGWPLRLPSQCSLSHLALNWMLLTRRVTAGFLEFGYGGGPSEHMASTSCPR